MKKIKSGLVLVALIATQSALADDLLERLEVATEKIGESQGKFYVSRVPELADKLPSWDWDDEIRSASKCVLDGIQEAKGDAVAEAYVAGLEIDAEKEFLSMAQLSSQSSIPDELKGDDRTIINLMQTCGTMEISMERLRSSGFLEAMEDPTVMQRLVAE